MVRISNERCPIFQEDLWWLVETHRDTGDTEESWPSSGNTEKGRKKWFREDFVQE